MSNKVPRKRMRVYDYMIKENARAVMKKRGYFPEIHGHCTKLCDSNAITHLPVHKQIPLLQC